MKRKEMLESIYGEDFEDNEDYYVLDIIIDNLEGRVYEILDRLEHGDVGSADMLVRKLSADLY